MERWYGKVAVVTGASTGFGAAIVKKLAGEGLEVVGLARRVEKIEEIANGLVNVPGKLHAMKCDVTVYEEVENTFKLIRENIGVVQILINNAGICTFGTFTEGDPEGWKSVMDTNVLGCLYCSRQVLGQLKELGWEGQIIHINSISGYYKFAGVAPDGFINAYSPSKNALTCINDILRHEMNFYKMPVKITSFAPGFTYDTDIRGPDRPADDPIRHLPTLQLEDINNAIIYILQMPPTVQVQELMIRPVGEFFL